MPAQHNQAHFQLNDILIVSIFLVEPLIYKINESDKAYLQIYYLCARTLVNKKKKNCVSKTIWLDFG